jgi:CBS domain-containing protein
MKTAADVMNRTFFHASPSDSIGVLLQEMAERGLGCVPVLDLTGRPLGVATAGEIERCYDAEELIERLAHPAVCMDQNTPIDVAARTLAGHPSCCLVLVDAKGIAVGALSPMQLLAAVLGCDGAPTSVTLHEREAAWDGADVLELGAAHRAPEAPGIILLSPGLDESKKRLVWAEPATNMRERLDQMLREPQDEQGLEAMLDVYPRTVRFRCLTIQDEAQRQQLADALCNIERHSVRAAAPAMEPEVSPRGAGSTRDAGRSAALDS